jgi:hypothetical protein
MGSLPPNRTRPAPPSHSHWTDKASHSHWTDKEGMTFQDRSSGSSRMIVGYPTHEIQQTVRKPGVRSTRAADRQTDRSA